MIVEYKHDPVGAMLVEEEVLTHSRVYPYGEGRTFPFALCQLTKSIRAVAMGRFNRQCDDSACFHSVVLGTVRNPDAIRMSRVVIEQKETLYELIRSQGSFFSWVGSDDIKTMIHAISNGQSIQTTRETYGDAGAWLEEWARVQKAVTSELCDRSCAKTNRGLDLITTFFPEKERKSIVGMSKMVKRDVDVTFRFFKLSSVEAAGLAAKVAYMSSRQIRIGCLIHDDVPCSRDPLAPMITMAHLRGRLIECHLILRQ